MLYGFVLANILPYSTEHCCNIPAIMQQHCNIAATLLQYYNVLCCMGCYGKPLIIRKKHPQGTEEVNSKQQLSNDTNNNRVCLDKNQ